ncbi:DUF4942 domain-containing protein [Arenimonas sp. MALMAid1274]|uniref:DUF4942 domain-containing protein n=1 Tax=Arenimonas sp. MALMAid1274 TaxID=3411630 RepID=UPI003B9EA65B
MKFQDRLPNVNLASKLDARNSALDYTLKAFKTIENAHGVALAGKMPIDGAETLANLRHHYRPGDPSSHAAFVRAYESQLELGGWARDLAARDSAIKLLRKALKLLDAAYLEAIQGGVAIGWDEAVGLVQQHYRAGDASSLKPAIAALQREMDIVAWRNALRDCGLWSATDVLDADRWEQIIRTQSGPLEDGMQAPWLYVLHARSATTWDTGLPMFFRLMSWNKKANAPVLLGPTVEIRQFVDPERRVSVSQKSLDELWQWMSFLGGGPEVSKPNTVSKLCAEAISEGRREVDTDLMHVRWTARNAVVSFKRPELVDRVNQVMLLLYPGALPA